MKLGLHALVLTVGLGLVAPVLAQEETKKEEAAKEETAAPAAAADPTPAAAPEAVPAKEEPAKPAAAAAPAKELSSCAKTFVPLSDTYKAAYDDMQKWITQIDTQTAAASDNVAKLQKQLEENQAALTAAKSGSDKSKTKELDKAGKKISDDLNTAKKDLSNVCNKFVKEAPDKIKQYANTTDKALDALKAQSK